MQKRFIEALRNNGRLCSTMPGVFTLGNAFCGFAAVVVTVESIAVDKGVPAAALWFIFLAMLFDVLDGLAARLLHARSTQGISLDSLADAVSFGVAPTLLMYAVGTDAAMPNPPFMMVVLLCSLFLGCTLWRLAVYNSHAILGSDQGNRLQFSGLPSPAAAAMICSMVWLTAQPDTPAPALAAYPLPVSLLMISKTPYPHLRHLTERLSLSVSAALGLSALALIVFLGMGGLVILSHVYLLSPLLCLAAARCMRRVEPQWIQKESDQ